MSDNTSSSRVFSPPLMRCCILSRRTSSMSRKILFRLALMFVLISSSCSFAKSCRICKALQHLDTKRSYSVGRHLASPCKLLL